MERPRKNSHFSYNTSRERLNPISSSSFYSSTSNPHKSSQDRSLNSFETQTAYSVVMADLGNASDAGHLSHETSASPPPAKRTRLNLKGKTPPQSISASPPANRITRHRSAAVASSASTSVAGDIQSSTPLVIQDGDLAQSTQNSRASSVMSASGPNTRSRKRKADQISSETSSMIGEPATQASIHLDVIAQTPATSTQQTRVTEDSSSALNPNDKLEVQDLDQAVRLNDDDQEREEQVTVSRRGRPPGRGRGGGRGGNRGGRGGKGKGRAKSRFNYMGPVLPELPKAPKDSEGALTDRDLIAYFGIGRKKTSSNRRVQAAYDRQADLKYNYKEVARLVRNGLEVLAEKSRDAVLEDPLYHQMVPEFGHVMDNLDAKRNETVSNFDRYFEMRLQNRIKQRRLDIEYYNMEFRCRIEDQMDREEAVAKQACLDTIRRARQLVDENASVAPEDQANYRVLPEEKPEIAGGEAAEEEMAEAGTASVRRTKRSSPKKRPAKELEAAEESVAKRPSLLSAAALPAEQPDDDQPLTEAGSASIVESALFSDDVPRPEDIDVNDNNQPLVFFPHNVRRGRQAEPNNRAVVRPHIAFENHEIGFRNIYAEAEGQGPQPKNFHLDVLSFDTPSGESQNLADHRVGDFDLDLVKRHKLHPQFGILIPGCRNPDNVEPQTDFSKPVARTNPITFLSADGKKAFETSRSTKYVHSEEDWGDFEKLADMHKTIRKYAPGSLKTLRKFATFDAVAREADAALLGAEELLQAATDIEDAAHAAKRFKAGDGSAAVTAEHNPTLFNSALESESDAFVRRNYPPQGAADSLQALADMAAYVSGDTVRSSPAPAQFVPKTNSQASTGFRSNYSPPKRTYSQAFSQMQGPGQMTKYFSAPMQASQQSMPAPSPRPLPKRREPPLPVEPTATHDMPPQQMGSQTNTSLSFVSQPAPLLRPQQTIPPPAIAPLPMAPPARAPQPTSNPTRRLQFSGSSSRAPPLATPHHASPYSNDPHMLANHMAASQQAAPNPMAPPALPNQPAGSHQMSPQLMSPRMMGPPPQMPSQTASPTMGPPQGSPQSMGPPPSLRDPSQSTFTRPRNMTGGQAMLPVPTPSQIPPPSMQSPQHLSQAQPYFQGAARQQHLQQQVPQQVQQQVQPQVQQHAQPVQPQGQPQVQQHVQQHVQPVQHQVQQQAQQPVQPQVQQHMQPMQHQVQPQVQQQVQQPVQQHLQPQPMQHVQQQHVQQQHVQQQHVQQQHVQQQHVQQQHVQQQHVQQQPVQQQPPVSSRSNRPGQSLPTLAPRPDGNKGQNRQAPRHPQHQYESATTVPQFQGPGAPQPERSYNYAARDAYEASARKVQQQQVQQQQAQQHVQQQHAQQAHPHGQQPSFTQAQTQPYLQSHSHGYPQPRTPKQQAPHLAQGQQYQPQMQQRQGQSPSQQFQNLPVQRQSQPSPQLPAQYYQQQATQPVQNQSPAQPYQRPVQQTPQSPAPQAEQRLKRKSFGGGDGMDERETYVHSTQFRPINKYPQPPRQLQHRSPYSMPQSAVQKLGPGPGPQQGQQPGQHLSGQQQPSFNAPPPPLAPPPSGRSGSGPYGA